MLLLRFVPPLLVVLLSVACVEERVDPLPQDARADIVRSDGTSFYDVQDEDAVADDVPAQDSDAVSLDAGVSCVPNDDGVIERGELPYVPGTQVLFVVNDDNTTVEMIDTAPTMGARGLEWDFSATRPADRRVLDEVQNPMGRWWQPLYPTADFALAVDRAGSLWALYRRTETALQMLATVSRETGRTNVAFTPPVDVLRFPLREGLTWTVTSSGNGIFNSIGTSTVNTYRFTVDRRGTVLTPAARFAVLRLRMDLEQTVTGTVLRRTQRTYLFLSECWGLVARIASVDNESAVEFTRASEYRRLGL